MNKVWMIVGALIVSLFTFTPAMAASYNGPPRDQVIASNFIWPTAIVNVKGTDYVWDDEAYIKKIVGNKAVTVANIKQIFPYLEAQGLDPDNFNSIRASHMVADSKGNIYVGASLLDGNLSTGYGEIYQFIMKFDGHNLSVIQFKDTGVYSNGEGSPYIFGNSMGVDPRIVQYGGTLLFNYLPANIVQPTMAITGTTMYVLEDGVPGIFSIDLSQPSYPVTNITTVSFGQNIPSNDLNGVECFIVPRNDHLMISDGNSYLFDVDLTNGTIQQQLTLSYSNEGIPYDFFNHGKFYNGTLFFLNDMGIVEMDQYNINYASIVFDPNTYHWTIPHGISEIADWTFVNDHAIDLIDFDNHRVIRLRFYTVYLTPSQSVDVGLNGPSGQ